MKTYALFQQYIWLVNTINKAGSGFESQDVFIFPFISLNL